MISVSWKSMALAPVALLAWGLSFLLPKRFHKHCFIMEANSIAGLFSDYVAIVLRKQAEVAPVVRTDLRQEQGQS